MNKNNVTECVLDELGKFDSRCNRKLSNDANRNPQIADVIEYLINLNYSKLYNDYSVEEESIYKTYARADDSSVNINFYGSLTTEKDNEFAFAGITIKGDKVLINLRGVSGTSQIILDNKKIESSVTFFDLKQDGYVDEYKYTFLNQHSEPYYYGFGKLINGSRVYEAGLESMLTEFEDRVMFTFHSADNLKPYSLVKGNIVGAIYGSNKVNTTENIFVTLKKETELRLEIAKKKQAKRTRKNLKE